MGSSAARATTIFLLGFLMRPGPLFAAEEAVTLAEATGRALVSNRLLKAGASAVKAAEAGVDVARARYFPRVFLDSGATVSTTPSRVFMMKLDEARIEPATDFAPSTLNDPSPRWDFQTSLAIQQPLLDLSIGTGVDAAQKDAESADLSLQIQNEQVALRVYEAFLEVRRAKAFLRVAEQGVADAREHDRLAASRHRNGVGLKSDELRARAEVAVAEQKLIGAEHDLTLARLRLNLVVGGKEGVPLDVAGEPTVPEPSEPQTDFVQLALLNRPDLKAGVTAIEKGDLALRQVRDSYYPTVYASAAYQLNDRDHPMGTDNDSWNAAINMRWELFDGTRRIYDKKRAAATRDAAAAMLEDQRREVAMQVREALLRRSEAVLKLASARAAHSAAEEDVRLVLKRFENGLAPMVELMDAHTSLQMARANVVEGENARLRATARLYYAAGMLLQEVTK